MIAEGQKRCCFKYQHHSIENKRKKNALQELSLQGIYHF
jgi:hypothetical protein